MTTTKRVSLVIETENLGMAGLDDLMSSLASLHTQTYRIRDIHEIIVIAGSHVTSRTKEIVAQQYPHVRIIESGVLEYTESKMRGVEEATGDIVIFADSDTSYESTCVENYVNLLMQMPEISVVGGDTRVRIESGYGLALNLAWMFPVLPSLTAPTPRAYFPLNNFAIRRDVMLAHPIPITVPLYRGKIGLWQLQLHQAGCVIYRTPHSRGFHAPPATLKDWWYRMLIHGSDAVARADFALSIDGSIVEQRSLHRRIRSFLLLPAKKILGFFARGTRLLCEDPRLLRFTLTGIPVAVASIAVIQLGACVALFNRDYLLRVISAHEAKHAV